MIKLIANMATALSLLVSASVAAPAWSAGKLGASPANCPDAKKKLAKRQSTVPPPAQPARSVMVVEKRKLDVQILSFGP